ncbi:DNA repair ATPase [Flexithrix dorotheae]|uniref:DNA repair ATPase n=1 Tax=Flexithrix dorotheae TaxID=70993 RepID=UPI00039D5EF6|nr:DNA repair ATPase [Flexithrix dorotheae]
MAEDHTENIQNEEVKLEGGTYEIIRKRLEKQGLELNSRLEKLNQSRKKVFGSIETKLLGTERIATSNNCIARDMVPIGNQFIFGYNVHMGLKTEMNLADVFNVYEYHSADHSFHEKGLDLIHDKRFETDFRELYKYYKETTFEKFIIIGPNLYFKFRIGKNKTDIKAFKFVIEGKHLKYVDNRSDHEIRFPAQHEFEWKRTHRDLHREGKYPHISILDRVFVETIGGDLTVKVEDNTDSGRGIYEEAVENSMQTLDDAEIFYADLGNLILMKIKPYQEKDFRYLIFNEKLGEVKRIDAINDACILLPDEQGIIFSNGYYLQSGELKIFDSQLTDMRFEQKIPSPNGEDFLFVFYSQESGDYILLSYNVIGQKVETPITCSGYSLFFNGEMVYFKADHNPKKQHALQVWQTPYLHPDHEAPSAMADNYLYKVGNKDIVGAMAACNELFNLTQRDDSYSGLYIDLAQKSAEILDSYFWLNKAEAFQLDETIAEIKNSATSAIDEFDKVTKVKENTSAEVKRVSEKVEALLKEVDRKIFKDIDEFVKFLADFRMASGEVISLKDLRYVDEELVEKYELSIKEKSEKLSEKCVEFLLRDDSLEHYIQQVGIQKEGIAKVETVNEAEKLGETIDQLGSDLELLIDIVSNLKIQDSTKTTEIIERISEIYANLNNVKAQLRNKRKELLSTEAVAEFNAQLKLMNQAVVNYIEVSDTPEKCEEYLTKLMVKVEELEGKFADFDEFIVELTEKRSEIYNAFEAKKLNLIEARNKKANALMSAAERILKGVKSKVGTLPTLNEINGYFASDLMIEKVREIIKQLTDLDDAVKSDDIQSRLKTLKEDSIRQLKDKNELFVDGENVIKFGRHKFSVNVQEFDLSIVPKNGEMFYHLAGTNFFEKVENEAFLATKSVWNQSLISENKDVYRAEYLAWQILKDFIKGDLEANLKDLPKKEFLEFVQKYMAPRYHEGYVKGLHDQDTALILWDLLDLHQQMGLLRYDTNSRACAAFYWHHLAAAEKKNILGHQIKGIGIILKVFPDSREYQEVLEDLMEDMETKISPTELFDTELISSAAEYLFFELCHNDEFVISKEAADIWHGFHDFIKRQKVVKAYEQSLKELEEAPIERFQLIKNWIKAYLKNAATDLGVIGAEKFIDEVAGLLYSGSFQPKLVVEVASTRKLSKLAGDHSVIEKGEYLLDYNQFERKLTDFEKHAVPKFQQFEALKKSLTAEFKSQIRLDEFKPRVLTSFVRNRLIDEVYLPLIGDNLAKQIGVVGDQKRTDLMGMLLLVSPPGYGKTTLMEYIANRLGVIFMKINGPAIGHQVTSIDPGEAKNATSREELKKLNLAFEMGDNVMIYLDDIQHCNPEFLQKFISLCDGQRKIEGVYKGVTRTYDMRGKKVCVVMAGNPYTESGEKFQIPDMLANRADTYNLGDIIGGSDEAFKLSYIENSLTSNSVLSKLTGKSKKDIYTIIRLAKTDNREGISFESNISAEELNEYVSVMKKLLIVQEVILKVNLQYIDSAAQEDDFRTEPAFKLQGSYRNMNKLAEKIFSVMNDKELETLLLSHYENESQTLTSGAEANLLKFKELVGKLGEEEAKRWVEIKTKFQKNQRFKGMGNQDQMTQVLMQMTSFTDGLEGIKNVLEQAAKQRKNGGGE